MGHHIVIGEQIDRACNRQGHVPQRRIEQDKWRHPDHVVGNEARRENGKTDPAQSYSPEKSGSRLFPSQPAESDGQRDDDEFQERLQREETV